MTMNRHQCDVCDRDLLSTRSTHQDLADITMRTERERLQSKTGGMQFAICHWSALRQIAEAGA